MRASNPFIPLSCRMAVLMLLVATVTHAQITPSQDAYTNSASPTTNYGAAVTLGVVNSAASIQTTYIQFDLSSIPAGYKSSNIVKATLKLYVNTVVTAGSFNLDFVNGAWTEKKVTSSLAPALGATIVASMPLTSANVKNYVLLDITSAVGAWLDGTQANDGIALVANSPLSATFDSKENTAQSQPPEIDIVFAGGDTITGVTTAGGSGLIGGGTSGTLNLSLTNACAANQILQWSGSAWTCTNMGGGGGGAVTSVGLTAPSTDFLVTGSPVTTSGTLGLGWLVAPDWNNTPGAIVKRDNSGNFSAGTINAETGFNLGGAAIASGSYASSNAFLGFAGNGTTTGSLNTASGSEALASNTTGNTNTASGVKALLTNTTGNQNTAIGSQALYYNTGGSNNTGLGYNAGPDQNSPSLMNATAIGANAVVSESNALVLGGTGSNAVSVGIGTATPAYTLDVQGTGNFTGLVKFASGQTFPGAGTIKGVTTAAGSGLTGGGTSGTLNLSLVKNCVSGQVLAWNGTAWVCTTVSSGGGTITGVTAGTDLTGGGSIGNVTLNVDTSKVPQLGTANTFTAAQTIGGNLTLTGSGHGVQFADGTLQTTAAPSGAGSCFETSSVSPIVPPGYTALSAVTAGNVWFPMAPITTARSDLAAAAVNGLIYAIGGGVTSSALNTVEVYNPTTNSWSTAAPMPTARGDLAAVAVNGLIYAIGGSNASTTNLNTVEVYNPTSNSWSTAASMPTARSALAAVAVNGLIYAIGGSNASVAMNTVEVYNPASNSWSTAAAMPTARLYLAAAAANGLIYAIGGSNSSGSTLNTVEVYHPSGNNWGNTFNMPTARWALAAAAVNGLIYAIGGTTAGDNSLNTVEVYNPSSASWSTAAAMSTPRDRLAAADVNGFAYAIGGQQPRTKPPDSSAVEQYSPPVTVYTFIKN